MALRLLTLDLEKVVATHVAIIIIITTIIIIIINWDRWEHHPPHLPTPPQRKLPHLVHHPSQLAIGNSELPL